MEKLLYLFPEKPQPVWFRYATTAVIMAFCMVVQIGLQNLSGFVGFFVVLPGIFATGFMFDRASSLYATALGAVFAYLSIISSTPVGG